MSGATDSRRIAGWLLLFFLANGIALNLVFLRISPVREGAHHRYWLPNTLHYSREYLTFQAGADSWLPMRAAIDQLREEGDKPLYRTLFFERGVKFQYAPTSLLLIEPFRGLSDDVLNGISWLAVLAVALLTARIFVLSYRRATGGDDVPRRAGLAFLGLSLLFTLTFYPILRGYRLGQIQVWIDFFFCAAVLAWMRGHTGASGALVGLACVIKPQLGLLLAWGLLRRHWRFVTGWTAVVAVFGLLSLWRYGPSHHLDYLSLLSHIGRHGEAYQPNQSLNGLLNRALFNGPHLVFQPSHFAPFHPLVFAGTTLGGLVLAGLALFWRRPAPRDPGVADLLVATLSFTMAAPIVWEHHYGIALPIFAAVLPAVLVRAPRRRLDVAALALAYVLVADKIEPATMAARTHWNFVESHVFFGGLLLLWQLYRIR